MSTVSSKGALAFPMNLFGRNISRKFALPLSYSFCRTAIIILIVIRNNNNAIPVPERRGNENYNRMRSSGFVLGECGTSSQPLGLIVAHCCIFLEFYSYLLFRLFVLTILHSHKPHTRTHWNVRCGREKKNCDGISEMVAAKTASASTSYYSFVCIENVACRKDTHV